jgi:hypothetical protein
MSTAASPSAAAALPVATDGVNVEVKPHKAASAKPRTICCGYTAKDLLLIPLALLLVYTLTGILFALCTRAVLQTDDTSTALWMFFGLYVAFVAVLGLVLGVTAYEKDQKQKHAPDADE